MHSLGKISRFDVDSFSRLCNLANAAVLFCLIDGVRRNLFLASNFVRSSGKASLDPLSRFLSGLDILESLKLAPRNAHAGIIVVDVKMEV